ncbi:MAG: HD domain-containing protein [Deltaproteobacteria bacterium]|nr:HD domain-containing protein [Deltaproteobacteria bacterium]
MVRYVDLIQDAPIKREELKEKEAEPRKTRKLDKGDMEEYRRIYLTVQDYLEGVRRRVTRHMDFDLEPAIDFLHNIIDTPNLITKLYQFTSEYGHEEDFTISHSINTMILSLKVGQGMGYSKDKLFEMGLAALFHDLGMFLVPDDILKKPDRLTTEESEAVRKHPEMIKVFLEQVSLYPMGSYVKLNNKSIAKVIDTNDQQPLRPVVNVLFDGQGNKMKVDQIVNLEENSLLWVVGNVSETDLPAGA